MLQRQKQSRFGFNRTGAVAVEFALTAPILFSILLASLELGHANMVLNTTEAACYEGARVAIVPGVTSSECIAATQRMLTLTKIKGATIQVTPGDLSNDSNTVTVRVTVPYGTNSITVPLFTRGLTIQRECTLTRERI
jgi:Flp pilus assembly protein TadG